MEKHNKEFFKKIANQLMFDLSDEEVEKMQEDFSDLLKQLALLEEVDTDGIEPMIHPFEEETKYAREDKITHVISQAEALKNAKRVEKGMILVPKVVK